MKHAVMVAMMLLLSQQGWSALVSTKVAGDLSKIQTDTALWKNAKVEAVSLMAQPMALPRPKVTLTPQLKVQSVHNDEWISFRLQWVDKEKNEAGRLGQFSDAVAMQFPVKEGNPPPIFMGAKGSPVHIFHWRAQYQRDHEKGKPQMADLYPNMNTDMYPMEFKNEEQMKGLSDENRETYSHGRAAGNPQSFPKNGVDEIFAEGFGSSAVIENVMAHAEGHWEKGQWTVIITRPLKRAEGSALEAGKNAFMGFAVWQGGADEVGARKSVTMSWVPLQIQ